MSDGPNGVRGTMFFEGKFNLNNLSTQSHEPHASLNFYLLLFLGIPSSCFPAATGLGASWDTALLHRIGKAIAVESKAKGSHIVLGPTINIQRSPLGGRGFESYSEDPYLSGTLARAFCEGLQEEGVAATIKHFVSLLLRYCGPIIMVWFLNSFGFVCVCARLRMIKNLR